MNGMFDVTGLDRLASMVELRAVSHEVGLQQGHILTLEDVPNSPCPSIPAPPPAFNALHAGHILMLQLVQTTNQCQTICANRTTHSFDSKQSLAMRLQT